MPAYQNYTKRSANNACLAEARGVAGKAVVELQDPSTTQGSAGIALNTIYTNKSACTGATAGQASAGSASATIATDNVTLGSDTNESKIAFTPKAPGDKFIECNITKGGSCMVTTAAVDGR